MAKFCGKCGSPLNDTSVFCGGCGSPVPAGAPAAPVAPAPVYTPVPAYTPVAAYVPGTPLPPAKKSNTLLKVIIAFVLLLFVGTALAVAGMWYAAQKIKQKAAEAEAKNPGLASVMGAVGGLAKSVASSSDARGSDDDPTVFKGDPCRFLSTQEVSQAVGVTIIRAEGENGGCSYIARGDPADMTSKHMTAMVGELAGPGMDAKTQKTIQSITGGFFAQQEAGDKDLSAEAAKGEVAVLGVMLTSGNAEAQMKLNRAGFKYVTGGGGSAASSGSGDLDGIGDDAYLAGGGMLIVRKGETIGRFMYTECPCNTASIKPLAKLAASRM